MYKLIACDLDETLLNDQHMITKENEEAIQEARKYGVKFVPATGRGFNSVKKILDKLDLSGKSDEYVIALNGSIVVNNNGEHLKKPECMEFELVNKLFSSGLHYNICIELYTENMVYGYRLNQDEKNFLDGRMEYIEFLEPNIHFLKNESIIKILFVNTDYSYLEDIKKELGDIVAETNVSFSSNRYMEFNSKGVSKGAGLENLAKLLGINLEDVIAIGDNFNDLTMIQKAGLGVGVRNAGAEIKKACTYVTQATNNESAVAEVVRRFIL